MKVKSLIIVTNIDHSKICRKKQLIYQTIMLTFLLEANHNFLKLLKGKSRQQIDKKCQIRFHFLFIYQYFLQDIMLSSREKTLKELIPTEKGHKERKFQN